MAGRGEGSGYYSRFDGSGNGGGGVDGMNSSGGWNVDDEGKFALILMLCSVIREWMNGGDNGISTSDKERMEGAAVFAKLC